MKLVIQICFLTIGADDTGGLITLAVVFSFKIAVKNIVLRSLAEDIIHCVVIRTVSKVRS